MNRRRFFLLSGGFAACARDKRPRLNVFNWSTYIDPAMLARFEGERGVRVHYATYESNEEMLARVMTGNSGWDVVFPTHSRLAPMARNGLLAETDHARLPSLGQLDPLFREPVWDPGLRWGVPYMWSATGIVYNRGAYKRDSAQPSGWEGLWDPALAGRMTMLDDPEDVIGACLQKLGRPFGSIEENDLLNAKREAVAQKKLLRAYLNAEVRDQLVSGDVLAAQMWSTTAAQAMRADTAIGFVFPREGFPLYCDCAAILRESARYELAHEFLDFLLRPEVAAANARAAETATANGPARALSPADAVTPVLYPDAATLQRGVWPEALPTAGQRRRDRIWTEIKAA